jgi:putative Ca2+/H+ antiporter (TMEM165/GDT1 family)
MKFTFTLTAEDCIHARRLAMRPRPSMRRVLYVVLALFAMATVWNLIEGVSTEHMDSKTWLFLGVGAYLYVIFFLWMPYNIRKVFKQQKTLHVPIEVELTDTHFFTTSAHGTFQMPWTDFHKWKKNDRMVLVYQSDALMHAIPTRALADVGDRQKLMEVLTQTLGPEKP